jgi:uncharacterized membrane protein
MSKHVMLPRITARQSIPFVTHVALVIFGFASIAQAQNATSMRHRMLPTDCWEMRSLGTLGGPTSSAVDMNDAGQVVGNSLTEVRILADTPPGDHLRAAFISAPNGGAITEILAWGYFEETATAINQAGQVVGRTTSGRSFPVSYVTEPGGANPRETLGMADVKDINNVGKSIFFKYMPFETAVIGDSYQPDIYGANLVEIKISSSEFPDSAMPVALNDAGQAALNAPAYNEYGTAYRWSPWEGAIAIDPTASFSRATSMNEAGQVIGVLDRGLGQQAFVMRRFNTSLLMLGQPGDGNQPTDINDIGVIVGTENTGGQTHGYVTTLLGVHTRINLSTLDEVTRDGWSDLRPAAINNRGQIAGTGKLNGNDIAFFLAPRSLLAYLPDRNGEHAKCFRWDTP